jgi:hypothetical protein
MSIILVRLVLRQILSRNADPRKYFLKKISFSQVLPSITINKTSKRQIILPYWGFCERTAKKWDFSKRKQKPIGRGVGIDTLMAAEEPQNGLI